MNEALLSLESLLDRLLPAGSGRTVDAARYSLLGGGKRVRPQLLIGFYRLCGGAYEEDALLMAAALEMIHTYSLIHDDLPCMDNDELRRGKPSCHKQFGEATALLAGDLLLTKAFFTASLCADTPRERVLESIRLLGEYAGECGMIGGQEADLAFEGQPVSAQEVRGMYLQKTAALLKAACQVGCVMAGASRAAVQRAGEYAERLGLAFQIIDDILDITADAAVLGKPIGSDEENGKTTFVSLVGLEKSRSIAGELTEQALAVLNEFPGDSGELKKLTSELLVRQY